MIERENKAFQLEEAEYTGKIGSKHSEVSDKIYQTLCQMEVSTTKCFMIPKDMVEKESQARSVVQHQRDTIRKNYPAKKDLSTKTQAIKDATGKYIGLRVWRIA